MRVFSRWDAYPGLFVFELQNIKSVFNETKMDFLSQILPHQFELKHRYKNIKFSDFYWKNSIFSFDIFSSWISQRDFPRRVNRGTQFQSVICRWQVELQNGMEKRNHMISCTRNTYSLYTALCIRGNTPIFHLIMWLGTLYLGIKLY